MSSKKYEVKVVSRAMATELVQANHYSPVMPKLTEHWLGVFKSEEMVGAVTLGWGTRPLHTIQKIINTEMESGHYLEIGKMCMLDSEPHNSETQMISQLIKWIKDRNLLIKKYKAPNIRNRQLAEGNMLGPVEHIADGFRDITDEVLFLYTLADGIMGKCGYVYQAANFYYGGEYWTDSYMSAKGEKIHPRTTRTLCKDNWSWHCDEDSEGFNQEFKVNHERKIKEAKQNGGKLPKEQVFWLTPEFMKHIGLRKIKGKMFRYIYPLNKTAKKILANNSNVEWKLGAGVYPKEVNGDLRWKEMVARKKYEFLDGIPNWDLQTVEHNKRNVNAHKK